MILLTHKLSMDRPGLFSEPTLARVSKLENQTMQVTLAEPRYGIDGSPRRTDQSTLQLRQAASRHVWQSIRVRLFPHLRALRMTMDSYQVALHSSRRQAQPITSHLTGSDRTIILLSLPATLR